MKYPLPDKRVKIIQGDQKIAKKCYMESLKLKKVITMGMNVIGIKVEEKSLKEALMDEGLATPGQADMEAMVKDLFQNDDNS